MTQLLDEMERLLCDLLQAGFSTGGISASRRAEKLSDQCEEAGLHTAAAILKKIEAELKSRSFQTEKDDRELLAQICASVRYIELARERLQEQQILDRWAERTGNGEGGDV